MSRIFAGEFGRVISQIKGGIYSVPWYLCFGEPRVGKSTVLKSMSLTWNQPPTIEGQYCHYWISNEAVIIEAREPLCGPNKNAEMLRELCDEILRVRPREPLDGILLVMSATDVAERADEALETHAQHLRSYLIETCRTVQADVPVYAIINRYDTLWGFAEVFSWNADRAKEEAWGFLVPPNVPSQESWPKIQDGIQGLVARIESHCLAKLSSDDGIEQRIRAYQHLVEARVFLERLRDVLKIVSFSSAYERAPWLRAVILGCSVPGVGDRIRAGIQRFANMGLMQSAYDPHPSPRPGGLPIHTFMKSIVLPEKELVPLKIKWRHDVVCVIGFVLGFLCIAAAIFVRYGLVRGL